MISWFGAILLVVGFVALIRAFRLVERSRLVLQTASQALAVVRDQSLSETDKERQLQQQAMTLFGLSFVLTLIGAASLLLPAAVVWTMGQLNWLDWNDVLATAVSVEFLLTTTVAATVIGFASQTTASDASEGYSKLDRLVHRIAFATYPSQVAIADVEDRLFAKQLKECRSTQPIFVTGLPRSGTTLLLECLANSPETATHRYADMPFVLTPLLWNRISQKNREQSRARERSHGDGMSIHVDSPEALEEVLWLSFWQEHYLPDRVRPWGDDTCPDFPEFLSNHIRKIILLRADGSPQNVRYTSKNNLNIARLPLLRRMFPQCSLIVPFRDPVQHAASLLRQHENFLRIHDQDRFALLYMSSIGHFDFGKDLRPIDFDDWLDNRAESSPTKLAFWIEYWTASYRHLLTNHRDSITLISYESLCTDGKATLGTLCDRLSFKSPSHICRHADTIHASAVRTPDLSNVPPLLLKEARDLYSALRNASL